MKNKSNTFARLFLLSLGVSILSMGYILLTLLGKPGAIPDSVYLLYCIILLSAIGAVKTVNDGAQEIASEDSAPSFTGRTELPLVIDGVDFIPEVGVENVKQNRRIVNAFVNFVLNETGGGGKVPTDGLQVKYSVMHNKHGLSHSEWKKLCTFLQARTYRGYMTRAPGGGIATWARRSYIYQTIERSRKMGKIGGLPHGDGVDTKEDGDGPGMSWMST